MTKKRSQHLPEIAKVFFKLGLFAFGGPAAHIAMMEKEVVEKRKWMSQQHFLDLIGATNLIPGPNSTEMTMHCGHERGGAKGLFVAGLSFIFPAIVLTGILGWLYVTYGEKPAVEPFIFGIKPAVLAIIAAAIYKLGKKALKGTEYWIIGILVLGVSLSGYVNEIFALLGAGFLGAVYFYAKRKGGASLRSLFPLAILPATTASVAQLSTIKVFLTFLKVGAILYGSGYVLFAYLDVELVEKGWMTRQQLLDAIAMGQFTPGPVLSTATFIGYQLNGISGALAASAGIFLPSFLFVWILNPLVPKMRSSQLLSSFLDAVNIAAVAIMTSVLFTMSYETLIDWKSIVIAAISAGVVFGFKKVSVIHIVLGGSILGYLLSFVTFQL